MSLYFQLHFFPTQYYFIDTQDIFYFQTPCWVVVLDQICSICHLTRNNHSRPLRVPPVPQSRHLHHPDLQLHQDLQ